MRISRQFVLSLFLCAAIAIPCRGDISLFTFEDENNNGEWDPTESFISGLEIIGYDNEGRAYPFLETTPGSFELPSLLFTDRLRVVVRGYNGELRQGKNRPTSVLFAEDGETIYVPVLTDVPLDPNATNILIPCYEKGASRLKNDSPAFVRFPFSSTGVAAEFGGTGPNPVKDAAISELGSTWGVAYQRSRQRAFASTIMKRHVGLGPHGLDAVYTLDYRTATPTINHFNLHGLTPSVGPPIDLGSVRREIVDVEIDETMPYALSTIDNRIRRASYDVDAFDKVGKVSFGDVEMQGDGRTLWMTNLKQRSLIAYDVGSDDLIPTREQLRHYLIDELPGIPNLNFRFRICINAGGNTNVNGAESFTDPNRVAWDKNRFSVGGGFGYRNFTVANTLDQANQTSSDGVYQTFRTGDFNYDIPVPVDEMYEVILHFAEPELYQPGDRVFDIMQGNEMLVENFDIVAHAGASRTATTLKLQVQSSNQHINLHFVPKQGARKNEALVAGVELIGQSIQPSGVLRPWGLSFHKGRGYLGVVADASTSLSREHLFAHVLSFDPNNVEAGFTEEVAFHLGYPRERASNAHQTNPQPLRSAAWQPWVDTWEETMIPTIGEPTNVRGALLCSYAQPIVSEIKFATDGSMIIGLMDRWAHQTGHNNYNTVLGDRTLIIGYASGDVLKAFKEPDGTFLLEKTNNDSGQFYSKTDGPSYAGEFFYDDYYATNLAHHGELITGGMAVIPGTDEVAATVHNPLVTNVPYFEFQGLFTQGLHFYDANTGQKTRAYLFVDQYILGKANGLGDMVLASDAAPPAVGNYVWCDANANGIQDPAEFGITGITVSLHDRENALALVDQVTTGPNGEFYFDELLPNNCYELQINLDDLRAQDYSGRVSPYQTTDSLFDSDALDDLVPGFAVIPFCTGDDAINRDDLDFGFLGPNALDATKILCEDPGLMVGIPPCAIFDLDELRACATDGTNTTVQIYGSFSDADSMLREITSDITVCGIDSTVYARVMINGDTRCYAISQIELIVIPTISGNRVDFVEFVCPTGTFDALNYLQAQGFRGDATTEFFTDFDKTMGFTGDPSAIPLTGSFPYVLYYDDTLAVGDCGICGSILLNPRPGSTVEAGDSTSVCGLECVDLTTLGATFNANGSGATNAMWSSSGSGTFLDDPSFANARWYCPDTMDLINGEVILTLRVLDDPCFGTSVFDTVVITIESDAPRIIPADRDTIDCYHPFALDPFANDTFPGCRLIVDCVDTLSGQVIDYEFILGDCENVIKQIKRTIRFRYDKREFFCMDSIAIRALPDTIICPPERDSVYCHDGYLVDANGHPSPLETGVPMADTIPLWPQLPGICDILVTYKDTEFNGICPTTIRRDWFIKNTCTGDYDTCVQWLMIFDTVPPTIDMADTVRLAQSNTHDCFAEVYVPAVAVSDTCTDVTMVKARIPNYGTTILTYNAETGLWESHKKFKLPVSELEIYSDFYLEALITGYDVIYEAYDGCHNVTYDTTFFIITDKTKPVSICDKMVNVTVTDTTVWLDASVFDEGSWDNCGIGLQLVRRSDWATACGVDLCDNLELYCATEHHDSLYVAWLEEDKHINPVEAHYYEAMRWLAEDPGACNAIVLMGWLYDLLAIPYLECTEHPYPVNRAHFNELLLDLQCASELDLITPYAPDFANEEIAIQYFTDIIRLLLNKPYLDGAGFERFLIDAGSQLGGGWSKAVPFCCEDACQDVMVEVLNMDYWCNWSKCWTTVRVEDKTPPKVVCELYDVSVTCASYKTYYEDAVNMALAGDFDSLQSVLGTYDKVEFDAYDNVAPKTTFDLYEISCDSNLVTKDSLFYDEHLGYVWKEYSYYRAAYDTLVSERYNGQVANNCGLICIEQKPWVDIDHCGNGYVKRVFKFVGQCSANGSGHVADTITRTQTIWITSDCEITPAMFEVPKDTIIYTCGIEYDPDGSGNVAGEGSPAHTGMARYTFDNDCRIVGIGYYDKVFKVVGGDEACYKIVRTWCFADWCDLGETPIEEAWWFNPRYEGRYLSYEQKIIMLDSTPPICTIDSIPPVIETAGCTYDLTTTVRVEDECGVLRYAWQVLDTKTLTVKGSGNGDLNSSMQDAFTVSVAELTTGSYVLKVLVTDECQNESVCEAFFVVDISKKPAPVCLSSITVELTPMDSNNDGQVDTAMAVVEAEQFNVSSTAPCGSSSSQLRYRIDRGDGAPALPPNSATSLALGCADVGEHQVRMYVLDQTTGNWDYCEVILIVQNNMGGCPGGSLSIEPNPAIMDQVKQAATRISVEQSEEVVPDASPSGPHSVGVKLAMHTVYPNPWRDQTTLAFELSVAAPVTISFYDVHGRLLANEHRDCDAGTTLWDLDRQMLDVTGVVIYRIHSGNQLYAGRMIVVD